MPEKMPNQNRPADPNSVESFLEYLKKDFFPRHGTKVLIALLLIGVAIFAVIQNLEAFKQKETVQAEELGKSLAYIYEGKGDSALTALEASIQGGSLTGLNLAKAALLAGNLHMQSGNLDNAESLYKSAVLNAGKAEIIYSAAEHGLAVLAMERQNYAEAISLLNAFVGKYGKRTGDLAKRYAKTEPVDAITTVPDAMWQLTLCYVETGDIEKAKQTAQKILKIYGESPRAPYAQKLLATLVEK
ncbi:MAG: tetratricopeptide repeat protein [Fibromonadaceae bacterium]|jgi:tetratricopeptide (TPR) repeat protein|nr:tetratricopeptide repeat protein [Fibromonadaceae bacterium]